MLNRLSHPGTPVIAELNKKFGFSKIYAEKLINRYYHWHREEKSRINGSLKEVLFILLELSMHQVKVRHISLHNKILINTQLLSNKNNFIFKNVKFSKKSINIRES